MTTVSVSVGPRGVQHHVSQSIVTECCGDDMTAVPEWVRPPRLEGWYADDLDHLPEAPRHTELIDGALVFMTSPQRSWHARIVTALAFFLAEQAPGEMVPGRKS